MARGQAFKEIGEAAAVRAELLQAKTELHRLSGEHHHVLEHNQELRQVGQSVCLTSRTARRMTVGDACAEESKGNVGRVRLCRLL